MRYRPTQDTQYARLCIIGAGPAGLSAATNASSEGLDTLILEAQSEIGGQARHSSRIENYLGFPSGLTGPQLMSRAASQAENFGTRIQLDSRASQLTLEGNLKCITLDTGAHILCHALLLASGLTWRKLEAQNIDQFHGKGVFYGASMDMGPNLKDKRVSIIGGANSAGQAALWFAKFAREVCMIVRGESLHSSMSDYLVQRILATSNITILIRAKVSECHGEEKLVGLTLDCEEITSLPTDCMFIFIGAEPQTSWLKQNCDLDDRGYIECNSSNATKCSGIFAAGDVRQGSTKRVASGVGDGAHTVSSIHKYLQEIGK